MAVFEVLDAIAVVFEGLALFLEVEVGEGGVKMLDGGGEGGEESGGREGFQVGVLGFDVK